MLKLTGPTNPSNEVLVKGLSLTGTPAGETGIVCKKHTTKRQLCNCNNRIHQSNKNFGVVGADKTKAERRSANNAKCNYTSIEDNKDNYKRLLM